MVDDAAREAIEDVNKRLDRAERMVDALIETLMSLIFHVDCDSTVAFRTFEKLNKVQWME